jgi:uncharacterized protein YggE
MRFALDLTFASLALLALPLMAVAQTPAGSPSLPSTLTVSGNGQVRSAPDIATVRLGMLTQKPSAQAAQVEVNRVTNAVLEALKSLGVKPEEIQTSDLSLNPLYAQPRAGEEGNPPKVVGYQASTLLSVRLKDLTKVGPAIDAGLRAGANRLEGVAFGLENDESARSEALARAVRSARQKAQVIAQAAGVALLEILEISDGGVAPTPPPYPQARFAMSMESGADTAVSAGQVALDAQVTLRYRIGAQGPK